jgi:carboxyl-terminal processing protease
MRLTRYLFLVLLVFVCGKTDFVFAQSRSSLHAQKAYMLVKTLEKYHYRPASFNDRLSEKLFDDFIENLDPNALYFTEDEIVALSPWNKKLDDEVLSKSTVFLEEITELYRRKLQEADTLLGIILSKPIDFNIKDTLFFDKKQSSSRYAKDEKKLKLRWLKWLKYELLIALYAPSGDDDQRFSKDANTLMLKEPGERAVLKVRNKRNISRILEASEGFEENVFSVFLNTLTNCYDPHTSFFSADDKQNFETQLSADGLSFGMDIEASENGEIAVSGLAPGGAAWKSSRIHKGDILINIKTSSDKTIDLTSASVDEANDIIQSINSKKADFTFRKVNGEINTIRLIKSKLIQDENVVKSFILKGEKSFGYISLPGFYTEWNTDNPLGCANDVAKEISRMQEENIEGLILDLRYNGGGSVREAIGLAGLFIDEGPLCIFKSRVGKPYLIKDMNRGSAYNGPLLVMINGLSASASELFADAMQDYHRAIIVGSSSFGKATAQITIPLDTNFSAEEVLQGVGSEKSLSI